MTLGIKNNNPLNVRLGKDKWVGQIDTTDGHGFVVFKSADYGIRAAGKILLNYETHHGLNTLRGIISRWAPPHENDTSAYIKDIAHQMAIGPDDKISLHRQLTMLALVMSMIKHENGKQPYPPDVLMAGVNLALGIN